MIKQLNGDIMEYSKRVLVDAIKFYKLIGGADELCNRGFKSEIAMDNAYMEEIEELLLNWLPDIYENTCILKADDCLEAEKALEKFFYEELAALLKVEV